MKYGSKYQLSYSGPKIRSVALMALGAETHHFDQNQRLVPLKFVQTESGISIESPSTDWEAPVGLYNLFLVSEAGSPSNGVSVRVGK
jgi:hypothetical protein